MSEFLFFLTWWLIGFAATLFQYYMDSKYEYELDGYALFYPTNQKITLIDLLKIMFTGLFGPFMLLAVLLFTFLRSRVIPSFKNIIVFDWSKKE